MEKQPQFTVEEMKKIDRCQSFPFRGKKGKGPVFVWIVAIVILLIVVILLVVHTAISKESGNLLKTLGGFTCIGFAVIVGYVVKVMQFDAMKALTQYFQDENGDFYRVQFTSVCAKRVRIRRRYSLVPLVGEVLTLVEAYRQLRVKEGLLDDAYVDEQEKVMAYYYVRRFQSGIKDWNAWSGGEAKVQLLGKLEHLKGNVYMASANGVTKKIRISDAYQIHLNR